jgi:hypothetical protein
MKLYAPCEYWQASEEERKKYCNGCGTSQGISSKLPLNTIYGLNVRKACCIHDWMYSFGKTLEDKLFADAIVIVNLSAIIIEYGGWLMFPRLLRASKYYVAVAIGGDDAYWDDKDQNQEVGISFKGRFNEIS